jgi:uncharacterized protein (DUF427 family)
VRFSAPYAEKCSEDGTNGREAAWYYPETKPRADNIRGRVAFWHGVTVEA